MDKSNPTEFKYEEKEYDFAKLDDYLHWLNGGIGKNLISELGWTRKRAAETRARLRAFEDDWDAPGMDEYDNL